MSWQQNNLTVFASSFAGAPKCEAGYRLTLFDEEIELLFSSSLPPLLSTDPKFGQFYEGLWNWDCGELFILEPSSGRYLEINIAPSGAWWSCVFESVRKRDTDCSPPEIEPVVSDFAPGWISGFRLSMIEVFRCLGSVDELQGNVTLIVGGCPDDDMNLGNLHSAVALSTADFHRPFEWVDLRSLTSDART